jgi:hypothetical protein
MMKIDLIGDQVDKSRYLNLNINNELFDILKIAVNIIILNSAI